MALEYDVETDRLTLSAELEAPEAQHALADYRTLLSYALLWRDTGGVATALTPDGTAMILLTLYGPELTAELLSTVVVNFARKARLLRTYVARGEGAPATIAAADLGFGAIRV